MADDMLEARRTDRALSARMRERLAGADQDLLRRREPAAQAVRRELLVGATVAIVGVGWPNKRFIYERAAELGVRLILVDERGHWGEGLVTEGIADAFVPVDVYMDVDKQVDQVRDGLAALGTDIDAVCTFWEDDVPVVARVARTLRLPGNDPEAVDAARSKRLTLVGTQGKGLPTPRFATITEVESLPYAIESVGFPAVIKPEFGSLGWGCYRVDSEAELVEARARIVSLLPTWHPIFTQYGTDLLLEEYLDGTEFDIDLLFSEGTCVYAAVAENWPTDEPYFYETGFHAPSGYPQDRLDELVELSIQGAKALGLELGCFHVEGKYTSAGARIVEINPRMGGDIIRDTNLMVHGVDLVEEHLIASVGIPINPVKSDRPQCGVAAVLVYANRTATIASTGFTERLATDPRVFYFEVGVEPGQPVQSAADGFPTRLVEVALRGRDASEAVAAVRQLASELTVSYR